MGVVFISVEAAADKGIAFVIRAKNSRSGCFLHALTVLQEISIYLTEYSKTPKPSRFSGFSFCLKTGFGAKLVQKRMKNADEHLPIATAIYQIVRIYNCKKKTFVIQ